MAELPQSDILHLINLGQWAQDHAIPRLQEIAKITVTTFDSDKAIADDALALLPKRLIEATEAICQTTT